MASGEDSDVREMVGVASACSLERGRRLSSGEDVAVVGKSMTGDGLVVVEAVSVVAIVVVMVVVGAAVVVVAVVGVVVVVVVVVAGVVVVDMVVEVEGVTLSASTLLSITSAAVVVLLIVERVAADSLAVTEVDLVVSTSKLERCVVKGIADEDEVETKACGGGQMH